MATVLPLTRALAIQEPATIQVERDRPPPTSLADFLPCPSCRHNEPGVCAIRAAAERSPVLAELDAIPVPHAMIVTDVKVKCLAYKPLVETRPGTSAREHLTLLAIVTFGGLVMWIVGRPLAEWVGTWLVWVP